MSCSGDADFSVPSRGFQGCAGNPPGCQQCKCEYLFIYEYYNLKLPLKIPCSIDLTPTSFYQYFILLFICTLGFSHEKLYGI